MAGIKNFAGRISAWSLPPSLLTLEAGFNRREDFGDIPELAEQIRIVSKVETPFKGWWDSTAEKFVITDGHRRYLALELLREQGFELELVKVELEDKDATEADLLYRQFLSNSGKPLTSLERGHLAQDLLAAGEDWSHILAASGVTEVTLRGDLELWSNKDLRAVVEDGKVAATVALAVLREHGEEAVAVIEEAAVLAEEDGRQRVTRGDIEGTSVRRGRPPQVVRIQVVKSPRDDRFYWAYVKGTEPLSPSARVGVGKNRAQALGNLVLRGGLPLEVL